MRPRQNAAVMRMDSVRYGKKLFAEGGATDHSRAAAINPNTDKANDVNVLYRNRLRLISFGETGFAPVLELACQTASRERRLASASLTSAVMRMSRSVGIAFDRYSRAVATSPGSWRPD